MTKRPTRLSLLRENKLLRSLAICQKEVLFVMRALKHWDSEWGDIARNDPYAAEWDSRLARAYSRLAKSRRKS